MGVLVLGEGFADGWVFGKLGGGDVGGGLLRVGGGGLRVDAAQLVKLNEGLFVQQGGEVVAGEDVALACQLALGKDIAVAEGGQGNLDAGVAPALLEDVAPVVAAGVEGAPVVKDYALDIGGDDAAVICLSRHLSPL